MIKIVTVFNSLNPGSFLQATALYNVVISKYDSKISFFDTGARHPIFSGTKLFLKLLKNFKLKRAFKQEMMSFKYVKELSKYNKTKSVSPDDIYILGSDEIWNVSRTKISKHNVFFADRKSVV